MEDGTTQGKMKGECMINPKFNVIIVTNIVILPMNIEVPLTLWKDDPTIGIEPWKVWHDVRNGWFINKFIYLCMYLPLISHLH